MFGAFFLGSCFFFREIETVSVRATWTWTACVGICGHFSISNDDCALRRSATSTSGLDAPTGNEIF